MAKVRLAARLGAAAFIAGVSLAIPQSIAIATADGTDTASAPDTSSGASPSRGSKPAARGATDRATDRPEVSAPRSAAAQRSVRAATAIAERPSTRTNGGHKTADTVPAVPHAMSVAAEESPRPVASAGAPARDIPAPTPAVVAPPRAADDPVVAVAAAPVVPVTAATSVPTGIARATAPASPGAVAAVTVSAGAGANAASAALIDRLLAPIRTLFGEGTALLVRRAFFNQAPTLTPVQLTGQGDGPITGTIGAVDLEGDPLSYKITGTPVHGSAVVNADGSYLYTPNTEFTGTDSFVVAVTDTGFHINLLDLARPTSTSANVAVARGAIAAMLRFQFIYGTGSQHWSSAARSALESAATTLSSYIVVDSPVVITYDVTGARSPFSSTLATAGSDFVNDNSGFLQTVVQSKILSGADANGSAADGTIDWNFGPSWGFGAAIPNTAYDFQSIAMHELLHTLGFLSNIDKAGSNTGQMWTLFDSYVMNAAGARVINNGPFTWNSAYNSNLTGGNGGLYFGGPDAVSVYQGLVPLYTPNPWESGSSLSHLRGNYLMKAVISMGTGIRTLSPVELAILSDIGYTVTGGAASPALLFIGFITLRVRRRRD